MVTDPPYGVNYQSAFRHTALFADVVMAGLRQAEFEVRSQIIWAKPTFVLGRGAYHWQHEPACGGAAATTVVELDTQSAAGNPTYLAVEQRSDEFAAKLLGLYDPPALPVGARPPALDHPAPARVRLLGHLSSDTLERAHAELTRPPDPRPAESDPA